MVKKIRFFHPLFKRNHPKIHLKLLSVERLRRNNLEEGAILDACAKCTKQLRFLKAHTSQPLPLRQQRMDGRGRKDSSSSLHKFTTLERHTQLIKRSSRYFWEKKRPLTPSATFRGLWFTTAQIHFIFPVQEMPSENISTV